jgi:OOP family OmpA-OmpF porin
MRRVPLLAAALLALASPARAYTSTDDKPDERTDLKDHAMVPRFPKSVLMDGEQKDFEEFALPVKFDAESGDFKTQTVEGRYTRLLYDNDAKASATEIVRNYAAALTKAGFKILVDIKQTATEPSAPSSTGSSACGPR